MDGMTKVDKYGSKEHPIPVLPSMCSDDHTGELPSIDSLLQDVSAEKQNMSQVTLPPINSLFAIINAHTTLQQPKESPLPQQVPGIDTNTLVAETSANVVQFECMLTQRGKRCLGFETAAPVIDGCLRVGKSVQVQFSFLNTSGKNFKFDIGCTLACPTIVGKFIHLSHGKHPRPNNITHHIKKSLVVTNTKSTMTFYIHCHGKYHKGLAEKDCALRILIGVNNVIVGRYNIPITCHGHKYTSGVTVAEITRELQNVPVIDTVIAL